MEEEIQPTCWAGLQVKGPSAIDDKVRVYGTAVVQKACMRTFITWNSTYTSNHDNISPSDLLPRQFRTWAISFSWLPFVLKVDLFSTFQIRARKLRWYSDQFLVFL